jgi:hypothetical protein
MKPVALLSGPVGAPNKQKRRLKALLVLGAVTGITLWFWPAADDSDTAVAPRTVRSAGSSTSREGSATGGARHVMGSIGFTSRHSSTAAQDLFAPHVWEHKAAPVAQAAVVVAPAAPTAPPLPYTFMGQIQKHGEKTVYFLSQGDRVMDVKVGDIVDGSWHVDSVSDTQLLLTYIPLKTQQSLSISGS